MLDTPLDILAGELGAVAGRIEREAHLRITAAIADLQRWSAQLDLREANIDARFEEVNRIISERIALIRDGRDGIDGKDGRDGADGTDGLNGKDGIDGVNGRDGLQGEAGRAGERGLDGTNGRDGADGKDGRDGLDGAIGERGPQGLEGIAGEPGKLPIVRAWSDEIHYQGDVVVFNGATYQAQRDTGRIPTHEDWICLAYAGLNGFNGRSFEIRGTYNPDTDDYHNLDVVVLNGASFAAKRDNPGQCPGEGWQLIASQGKQGKPGDRGPSGPKGDRGLSGPAVSALEVDGDGLFRLKNTDGSVVDVDLYPLLAKLA